MQKYIILIVAVFIQLCLGVGYSWSTFVPALKQNFGLSIAQTQTIFGTGSLVITLFIFFGGRIQDRLGPRIPVVVGGIILGSSYILAGCSNGSYSALRLLIGVCAAIGVGICYLCPIACSVKWFPNHKSLADRHCRCRIWRKPYYYFPDRRISIVSSSECAGYFQIYGISLSDNYYYSRHIFTKPASGERFLKPLPLISKQSIFSKTVTSGVSYVAYFPVYV